MSVEQLASEEKLIEEMRATDYLPGADRETLLLAANMTMRGVRWNMHQAEQWVTWKPKPSEAWCCEMWQAHDLWRTVVGYGETRAAAFQEAALSFELQKLEALCT